MSGGPEWRGTSSGVSAVSTSSRSDAGCGEFRGTVGCVVAVVGRLLRSLSRLRLRRRPVAGRPARARGRA
eukprot:9094316-Lingulodinium_polyedra.AAC.1